MNVTIMRRVVVASLLSLAAFTTVPAHCEDKKVLLVLWKGETDAERAFKAKLAELGQTVSFTAINAEQDRAKLAAAIRPLADDLNAKKFAAVYSYGTVGTQVAKTVITNDTPIIFNIVFDPVRANLVKSNEEPGGTLTGVTNGVSIPAQFDKFMQISPIKNLLVLFNSREPNSNLIEKEVQDWAKKNGVNLISRRVTPDTKSLAEVLEEINSGKLVVDSLFAGQDNYLASVAKEVHASVGGKVRLYGGTQTYIWGGWLAAYTPLVSDMGVTAAEQMAKVLSGKSPATLPVVLPQPKLFVSKAAAEKHGITPPADAVMEK